MKVIRDYFAIVALALLMMAILIAACGCVGFGGGATVDGGIRQTEDGNGMIVTLDKNKKLPDNVTVKSGEDAQDYVPPEDAKREAKTFPIDVFLGWLIPAGALCTAAYLLGAKPMIPIIAGGGIIVATAMAASLALWEILFSLLALAVIAALVFGLMWLRRSRTLKKIVTNVEHKAETDPVFNAAVTDAMTDADGRNVLSDAETALVDKIRKKKGKKK